MGHGTTDKAGVEPLPLPAMADLALFTADSAILEGRSIVGFDNRDPRCRPFSLLRTQVAKRITSQKAGIVGITSATPNAGKSFISLNLAASLAHVAKSAVYLIDLDFRHATIAHNLGMDVAVGVSDFLERATDDLGSIGRRVENSNLAIFPSRSIRENSAELLAGDRFLQLLNTFRAIPGNPIVICDMPPVFANDDTMIAMQKLDGYFMVVDSGKTTRSQVQSTMSILQPAPCLGAILNRYEGGMGASYGIGYGYGYGSKSYDAYY